MCVVQLIQSAQMASRSIVLAMWYLTSDTFVYSCAKLKNKTKTKDKQTKTLESTCKSNVSLVLILKIKNISLFITELKFFFI